MSCTQTARVAGVVLAAGASSRFGSLKQTLAWGEQNFVNAVLRTARLAGLDPLILVLGNQAELIKKTLTERDVRIVNNPDWQQGQSSSLKAALSALEVEVSGAIFLLTDQPQLSVNFIAAIAEAGIRTGKAVIPYINDHRCSPVFFSSQCFDKFLNLEGDQGGRQILGDCPHTLLPWLDEWMARDVDTPEDYRQLCQHFGMPFPANVV